MKIRDLTDQFSTPPPRPFLWCRECGGEYSAHLGDYFMSPPDKILICCGRLLVLAKKEEVYNIIR